MRNKRRSYRWLTGAAAGLTAFASGKEMLQAASPPPCDGLVQRRLALGEFVFHYEGVLGTSMELVLQAGDLASARHCEQQVLAEIERLQRILSTRDSASEISRFHAGLTSASPELAQLLDAYQFCGRRTAGAIDVNMAGVIRLWEEAQAAQCLPDAASLADAFNGRLAFNVDALGKGFIVDRAVEVGRQFAWAGLLNIGGDLRAWGNHSWSAGVADPRNPAENAPLLDRFALREGAVATSGGYARNYTIDGNRYSHVIDPRTLHPVDGFVSATVVAADCLTANALSTAACVLGKMDGVNILRSSGALGYLLTDAAQPDVRGGLLLTSSASPEKSGTPMAFQPNAWPQDFQVSVNLEIKAPAPGRYKRPYVAVWIQDQNENYICTVAIWGTKDKYISELSHWWSAGGGDRAFGRYRAISRATRPPGKYTVVWDGRDDQGNAVPKRNYTVCVEFNREHGHHGMESALLSCGVEKKSAKLPATV